MASEHPGSGISRRAWLQAGAAACLATGLPLPSMAAEPDDQPAPAARRGAEPRNIIFMVADGMSAGMPSLAEAFSQLTRQRSTHWFELLATGRAAPGFFEMGSLTSLVTDSAAAATAWASGSRVLNGAINTLPDGTALTPIAPLVRATGRRIGLVTTTTITHATPAGFAAVQADRDDEHLIAPQYRQCVDVLMGGGVEFFTSDRRRDGRDLLAEYASAGYAVWRNRADVKPPAALQQIVGVFDTGHLPYVLDWLHDDELQRQVPTLAEMTTAALASLRHAPDGFLLQVEGGRVDHAAHKNDAGAILHEQLAFDDALGVVLAFVEEHPDTLLIVTTDHGNANPGLNGMGSKYRDSNRCFERLTQAKASVGTLARRIRGVTSDAEHLDADAVIEVVRAGLGLTITADEAAILQRATYGQLPPELNTQHRNSVGIFGQVLGNYTGIGWTGIKHTADWVMNLAMGPGSDRFAGLLRNTQVYERLTGLLGIGHRNPQMTARQAARHLAAAPHADRPHWT